MMGIPKTAVSCLIWVLFWESTCGAPTVFNIISNYNKVGEVPKICSGTLIAKNAILTAASCVYDRNLKKPYRYLKVNDLEIGKTKTAVHVSKYWSKTYHPNYDMALVMITDQQSTPTTKLKCSSYSIEQLQVKLKTTTKEYAGCSSLETLGNNLNSVNDRWIPFKCPTLTTETQGTSIYQTNNGVDEVFGLYNGACTIGWGPKSKKGHCGVRVTKTTFDEICAVAKAQQITINGCTDVFLTKGAGDPEPTVLSSSSAFTAVIDSQPGTHALLLKFCPQAGCCGASSSLFGRLEARATGHPELIVRQINMADFRVNVDETPTILYRPLGREYYIIYKGTLNDFENWKVKIDTEIAAGRLRRGLNGNPEKRAKPVIFAGYNFTEVCSDAENSYRVIPNLSGHYDINIGNYMHRDLAFEELHRYCKRCSETDIDTGRCSVFVDDGAFISKENIADLTNERAENSYKHLKTLNICQGFSKCTPDAGTEEPNEGKGSMDSDGAFSQCKQFFIAEKLPTFAPGESTNHKKICQGHNEKSPTKYYFATLYDTSRKIPHWSAYKVTNICSSSKRPLYWRKNRELSCTQQAVPDDYILHSSGMGRGHLNPSAINNCDLKEQSATFTLTNAAPQIHTFGGASKWAKYERYTREYFSNVCKTASGQLYLITGTKGDSSFGSLNGVKVPRYFWTAGCCVKKTHKYPYDDPDDFIGSFAYYGENTETSTILSLEVSALETFLGNGIKLFPGYSFCETSKNSPKSDLEKYLNS
ncbi:unnamed protein product [Owenia fusiformis]|uniref:Peptidase S1 domain-containing protein n=1 Tax=Owenia fusiformis TaxID=6347 RepID=A0A8S4NK21_OWEFU|nr:unnamed protein product [Owenia fusiformis]